MRAFVGTATILSAIPLAIACPVSAQPVGAPNCLVVYNNGGGKTGVERFDAFWTAMDQAIGKLMTDGLAARGYDVRYRLRTIPPHAGADAVMTEAVQQLNASKCAKLVEVSRHNEGVNEAATFSYLIRIFHFDRKPVSGGTAYMAVGDYSKDYSYPLNKKVFDTLVISDLGDKMAGDIDASKTLADFKSVPQKPGN